MAVIFPDGQKFTGAVLGTDKFGHDLAAVEIAAKVGEALRVPTVQVAAVAPKPLEEVLKVGYPAATNRVMDVGQGTAVLNAGTLWISTEARSGDSGGGIFNLRGELVSVLHSRTDDKRTLATSYERTVAFYERVCERWFQRRPAPPQNGGDKPPVPGPAPQAPWSPAPGRDGKDGRDGVDGKDGKPADDSKLGRALDIAERVEPYASWLGPIAAGAIGGPVGGVIGLGIWGLRGLLRLRRAARGGAAPQPPPAAGATPPAAPPFPAPNGGTQADSRLARRLAQIEAALATLLNRQPPSPPPERVVVTTPEQPEQVIRTQQSFVPYEESNHEAQALRHALAVCADKYPGSINTIKFVNDLATQIMSGQPQPAS